MPASIKRNTQRIDDPQVNISWPVISMSATSRQFLATPPPNCVLLRLRGADLALNPCEQLFCFHEG
jgi:hypothetical protein